MLRRSFLALVLLSASAVPSALQAQPTAIIEILPTPAAHNQSKGIAVSSDGRTIVGHSGVGLDFYAHRWNGGTEQTLGTLPGLTERSEAYGVSGDGSVVVGYSQTQPNQRAFRWTTEGMVVLPSNPDMVGERRSCAYGISDDGTIIVGEALTFPNYKHACYWDAGGIHMLGTIGDAPGTSQARAASADGSVIVGQSPSPTVFFGRAFRWEDDDDDEMEDLGSLDGPSGLSYAEGVSADGEIVVGYANTFGGSVERPFRWKRDTGMVELESLTPNTFFNRAYDVSDDGRVIVGVSSNSGPAGGNACIWIDGEARTLWDVLTVDYGMNLNALGWAYFTEIESCSADGRILTGSAGHRMGTMQVQKTVAFRVTLPRLSNSPPTIASQVAEGSNRVAAVGSTFLATFNGSDVDADEELTLEVDGLPPGAVMTPVEGTTGPGTPAVPFLSTFEWTPQASDIGTPYDVTISYRDTFGAVASRSFTITARSNATPTVQAIDPETLECEDGDHFVELSTVVADSDGDPLTVTWKVNGIQRKTENVASGATVTFGTSYAHGSHSVLVEASDGFVKGSAGTTVTVVDTGDPLIVVAGDAVLTTDPGKDYASKSRLTPPTAEDGSGHAVTLTSDAPSKFPLGETIVAWMATDGAGHSATATQKVTVVDEESPIIEPAAAIRRNCDPRKTYATIALTPPDVTDNVSGDVIAETTAGPQFAIGVHRVLWTATDADGNTAEWLQTVTVVNRKPKANAGKNATVTTKSERGVKVVLDGSRSADPDKHKLKYKWTAKGVRLAGATTAKPSGTFPVGTTTVSLTVTDVAGAKHTDTVKVTVKLQSSRKRAFGEAANRSFAAAAKHAGSAPSVAASSGIAHANVAAGLGDAAGDFVRWEEGQSEADALLAYAELRALQQAYGAAAADSLLAAYAETGDESLLAAYGHAVSGAAYASADLSER